ncbi:MAG: DUF4270 family protein [Chitinophagaceae bacterium]|nr:MAG: DUF4270 family protein [Chitinophagaceae bacterium]
MKRKILAPLSAFALLITVYTACTRIDTTDIGNNLIPVVDNINTFDTILEVTTDNFLFNDTSRVYDTENHALGVIASDPVFGKISAGIYFNFTPLAYGGYPFINKDSIKVPFDSVVLSLDFRAVYGDSLSTQTFQISEIANDPRFQDTARGYLISNEPLNLGSTITNFTQDFDRLSDIKYYKTPADTGITATAGMLRVHLPVSFGDRFFNYDTTVYRNDTNFRAQFPGLAILPTGGSQNALAYFNLSNVAKTRLTFYYKAKSFNGVTDSAFSTYFTFRNYRNLNKIERNIAGTEYANAMNPGTESDERLYIASSPGSYATIKIPALPTLPNAVIHRAELIATPVNTPGLPYQEPDYLFLDAWDSVANLPKTIQNDFVFNSSTSAYNQALFGGYLRNGKYTFDVSRYVQGIVTRKEPSYTLRLYAPYKTASVYVPTGTYNTYPSSGLIQIDTVAKKNNVMIYLNENISYGRTVIAGGTHPTNKMYLRIIYSKI